MTHRTFLQVLGLIVVVALAVYFVADAFEHRQVITLHSCNGDMPCRTYTVELRGFTQSMPEIQALSREIVDGLGELREDLR